MRDESGVWHKHPAAPGELAQFALGTDYDGRDILSRLLWAVRPTLQITVLAVALRLALGIAIGTVAGWSTSRIGDSVRGIVPAVSAVPLLIVALIWSHVVGLARGVGDIVIALALTGWSATAALVTGRVRVLRSATCVEAARSLGASDFQIIWRHVRRDLTSAVPMMATFDCAAVLLILGELGFLGFYFGTDEFRSIPDANSAGVILKLVPGHPELSQMLSVGWDNFFQTPWLSLWAGLAFLVAVLGFTLTGEGLQRRSSNRA